MKQAAKKRSVHGRQPSRKRNALGRGKPTTQAVRNKRARPRARSGARAGQGRNARPSRHARRTRRLRIGFGILAAVVALGALGLGWFVGRPGPAARGRVAVNWPAELSASEAAELLADLGLVERPAAVAAFLRASGAPACFRPGPHLLPQQASPRELRRLLCRSADRPRVRAPIPEGFSRFAIATRLDELGVCSRGSFLRATADRELLVELGVEPAAWEPATTAEGYLFPATYELFVDADPRLVTARLVGEAQRRWSRLAAVHAEGLNELAHTLDWGRREVITLASMVEKEAAADDERGLIASVFLNRLRDPAFAPKLLQSDPTSAYGCYAMAEQIPACRQFTGRVSPALNHDPHNRYSTYVHPRLPPGPIANPGEAAIEAVLAPRHTSYLYFVAAGQGRHTFSQTLQEHNRAVRRLRTRSPKEAGR